jgi:hypothetical protein
VWDTGIDGRIILKLILNKCGLMIFFWILTLVFSQVGINVSEEHTVPILSPEEHVRASNLTQM